MPPLITLDRTAMSCQQTMTSGLPPSTRLTRRILIVLVAAFIAQTIAENWLHLPVMRLLGWWSPLTPEFAPWQPVTALLLQGPGPIGAAISWLVFYFFFPSAERSLGARRVFRNLLTSWLSAILFTLVLQFLGLIGPSPVPFIGIHCILTALTVIFGLTNPDARILLFFILPVRASWVAWGTGLLSFLFLLYGRDMSSSIAFFGWCGALADLVGRAWILKHWYRWRLSRLEREKASRMGRFRVIQGGRPPKDDDEIIYH